MIKKLGAAAIALCLAAALVVLFWPQPAQEGQLDVVALNDTVQQVAESLGEIDAGSGLPAGPGGAPYAVFSPAGELIAQSPGSSYSSLNDAVRDRATIVDAMQGSEVVAKVAIANDWQGQLDAATTQVKAAAVAAIAVCLLLVLLVLAFIHRRLLKPLAGMQDTARRIAANDLDVPLAMGRDNSLGAFTESLDLLRSSLATARAREVAAEKGKKELVASLSHDIKTPLASIQATAELMQAQAAEQRQRDQLDVIIAKANQITGLTNDLFQATLEDLEQLEVAPRELPSPQLAAAIAAADYEQRITHLDIPQCLVCADPLRFSQIADNILGNSYKYAATPIQVVAVIEASMLVISFQDSGPGAPPESLAVLTHKYHRGANAADKPGAGLGLYLAHYFATRMAGTLECQNTNPGFSVTVTLPLV
jgi:signal transduction histidine kinase